VISKKSKNKQGPASGQELEPDNSIYYCGAVAMFGLLLILAAFCLLPGSETSVKNAWKEDDLNPEDQV